jgi:hypothetical protein
VSDALRTTLALDMPMSIYRELGVKYTLNQERSNGRKDIRRRAVGGRKVAAANRHSHFGRPSGNESPSSCSLCNYVNKEY